MVSMSDRGIGPISRVPPLPPFVTADEVLRDSLPLLDPPSRISVTDAAERYLKVPAQGNWVTYDREVAPYTVEPQDMTQSRRFKAVCFVGPSQSGKSQMLLSTALHSVLCAPGPMQIIHMTKTDGDAWVEEKLDPAISNSPDWRERLGTAREDSTFQRKRFKGMRLAIGYPVANQLSSRTQRIVMLTDYDHMPQRLGPKDSPEGSPFGMALLRIRQYMSRGCVLVESTPAFPINEASEWVPSAAHPHMMPPATAGIVNIYNEGTRGRWYWQCPDCSDLYEPTFARLHYNPELEPAEAGAAAQMQCPHCGSLLEHRHKTEINRAALSGRGGWLHESRFIDEAGRCILVRIHDDRIRSTPTASYALNGAAATFAPWYELVQRYETERRRFERDHDDTDFAKVFYTDIGVSYRRPGDEDESGLNLDGLLETACDLERMQCPSWTRFIVLSVDAQGSWFAVSATAFGVDGRRMIIDRFDLRDAPDHARRAKDAEGRARALDPGRYAEDADVLTPLLAREYRVAGAGWSLKPCAMVIDFNGPAGWSDNAEKFWRARRREGLGDRVFLSIGRGGFRVLDRVWLATPERGSKGKRARSIKLLNMAVDRIKDSVLAALGHGADGPGAMLVARHIERDHVNELLAEKRGDDGYEKRPGVVRNEMLDLAVQALAVAEHKGINRLNPEAPPDWAVGGLGNPFAVALAREEPAPSRAAEPTHPVPSGIKFLRRP
ncbi:phage terminase large subunit family protein [Cereibacter sphaeroides]|nr:phage terminase large subunit family protein [Cereibacter sphaeroides]